MDKLISDSAKSEISKKVMDILRTYSIDNWNSEPYHQNQNPAEWRYRTIKAWTNNVMNRSGAPANCWLLCMSYVCYVLNHIACKALDGAVPLLVLYGITPDISIIMLYTFYQPVFYATHDQNFPSQSEERAGHWVGFGEHCGDAMTHKILDDVNQTVIYRSAVRPRDPKNPNKRLVPDGGEPPSSSPLPPSKKLLPPSEKPTNFVTSRHDDDPSVHKPMPEFDPKDLIGRTFLLPPEENGERFRAKVTQQVIKKMEDDEEARKEEIHFLIDIGNGKLEELISFNQLLDYLEQNEADESIMDPDSFKFRDIIDHEGPLTPRSKNWKGSSWNIKIEWETGEITWEPLDMIAKDDPVTCAVYAKKNNLQNLPGWKRFRHLIKHDKILARAIKQTKIRQVRRSNKYMFGYLIPKTYLEALEFDKQNGDSRWYDATELEMQAIKEYQVFIKGPKAIFDKHRKVVNAPKGYQKIRVHLIFAVKASGKFKARLVADGHLTPEPVESIYSGVVSLRNLRLVIFLGKLNELEIWGADIGNAYLEAYTDEKLYIVAGPEFQELEGHILIFNKALYGLKSSGKRWEERFHDILKSMDLYQLRQIQAYG